MSNGKPARRGRNEGRERDRRLVLMEAIEGRTMLSAAAAGTTGRISGIAVDPSDPSGSTMATAPTLSAPSATSADRSYKPLFAFYVEGLD
jgi:hypothetical protein